MILNETEARIPKYVGDDGILNHFARNITERISPGELPIRFVVTHSDEQGYQCELGMLSCDKGGETPEIDSIFHFRKRDRESVDEFNAVLLIPTGIGAEIGGHSGDAGPVARLLASACDSLVIHPNVVNASDINEMPENALYVEGSVITRLLMGTVGLQKVRSNRVMLVIDRHEDPFFHEAAINSASAARATLGAECPLVVVMDDKVLMRSLYSSSGRAVGRVEYLELLCNILEEHRSEYDAVALSTLIDIPEHFDRDYFRNDIDMINPWGGVEAMLTHALSLMFDIPTAHSPMMPSKESMNFDVGVVDPRKAAEAVSTTNLHCILKGLHRSPRIIPNPPSYGLPGLLTAADISCLVIPDGCVGLPTLAAMEQRIPVIAVRENKNRMQNDLKGLPFAPGKLFVVDNYLEAVGIMSALKAGVAPETVRRPLGRTKVIESPRSSMSQHPLIESIGSFDQLSDGSNL